MSLSDAELRAMVREAIARHAGGESAAEPEHGTNTTLHFTPHASHALLPLVRGGDADGACLIEPAVRCNHCGYCQSFGH